MAFASANFVTATTQAVAFAVVVAVAAVDSP